MSWGILTDPFATFANDPGVIRFECGEREAIMVPQFGAHGDYQGSSRYFARVKGSDKGCSPNGLAATMLYIKGEDCEVLT